MKKTDFAFLAVFLAATLIMVWPETARHLEGLTHNQRYRLGFLTFALLGPVGDLAAARLSGVLCPRPALLAAQALMWGLYGLSAALFFWLFNGAVALAQGTGLLPGGAWRFGGSFLTAFFSGSFFTEPFFTSLLVCCCFTLPFLAVRRLVGAALNILGAEGRWPDLRRASEAADWPDFIRSEAVILPLFRAPGLTFVFMLPSGLWLFTAAWFGVLLGGLIGLNRRKRP